ncbi:uncharacterized protein LOC115693611 [Syzygium oleosum]|uniref:uncharacterized protein LOC115693611 n=1 Tax=Syzygium oleosum TaxID=219896 RepID=UPI0011D2AC9D|nr:uncharacterized protein LOC115693611 [Syzygium oleosum]
MRGLRRSAMTAMMPLLLLVVLVLFYEALSLADNVTFVVVNTTNYTIFPRVVGAGSGGPTMDFAAVPPKGSVRLSFKRDSHFCLFFATDCSQDESGRLIECSSGNCPNEGCTSVDNPVATMIYYDNGTVTASGPFGYNFAVRAEFLSADGKCPPVSCDIPLSKCPKGLRMLEESSGSLVACKAPDKVPYCQGGAATSCFDGAILTITVS